MQYYLAIEQWWIVIDICYLYCERANAFQWRFTLIRSFDSHRHKFTIVAFTIKHLKQPERKNFKSIS